MNSITLAEYSDCYDDLDDDSTSSSGGFTFPEVSPITKFETTSVEVSLLDALKENVGGCVTKVQLIQPITSNQIELVRRATFKHNNKEVRAHVGPMGAKQITREVWDNMNICVSDSCGGGRSLFMTGSGEYNVWAIRNVILGYEWYTLEIRSSPHSFYFIAGYDGMDWKLVRLQKFPGLSVVVKDGTVYTQDVTGLCVFLGDGSPLNEDLTNASLHELRCVDNPTLSPCDVTCPDDMDPSYGGLLLYINHEVYRLECISTFVLMACGTWAQDSDNRKYCLDCPSQGMVRVCKTGDGDCYRVVRQCEDVLGPDSTKTVKRVGGRKVYADYYSITGCRKQDSIISRFGYDLGDCLCARSAMFHYCGMGLSKELLSGLDAKKLGKRPDVTEFANKTTFDFKRYLNAIVLFSSYCDYSKIAQWLYDHGFYVVAGSVRKPVYHDWYYKDLNCKNDKIDLGLCMWKTGMEGSFVSPVLHASVNSYDNTDAIKSMKVAKDMAYRRLSVQIASELQEEESDIPKNIDKVINGSYRVSSHYKTVPGVYEGGLFPQLSFRNTMAQCLGYVCDDPIAPFKATVDNVD